MIQDDSIPPVAWDLAASITRAAALEDAPPYEIGRAAMMRLPLDVIGIRELTPSQINQWLLHRGVKYCLQVVERELHGCLLAYRSTGLVFVDSGDSAPEQRYTIAHEVAHFIVDYWTPRQSALAALGPSIQAVLDGVRAPSIDERLDSIFVQVRLRPYVCLLDRGSRTPHRTEVWIAENRADQVALELLAPREEVCREVQKGQDCEGSFQCRSKALRVLIERFGLPDHAARPYARSIADEITNGMSVIESWGL